MPPTLSTLVLIDGMNLAYRSFHAHKILNSTDGVPTGMFYGLLASILKLQKQSRDIIFCWDAYPSWRHTLTPSYKQSRRRDMTPTMLRERELLFSQLDEFKGFCSAGLGILQVSVPLLEADDLICLMAQAAAPHRKVVMYSNDRDLYQALIHDNISILRPTTAGKEEQLTATDVEAKYGIRIREWACYLALGGDQSDDIKPLRGIGPKTALKWIQKGLSLDAQHFNHLPASARAQLPDLGAKWSLLRAAYCLASILPAETLSRMDEAAGILLGAYCHTAPIYHRAAGSLVEFMKFCARYEMQEFLARRWDFFKRGEQ